MSASPPIRSFLFVPADSERKYQKASGTKADALILDLEDSVAQENLPTAREMARAGIEIGAHSATQARHNQGSCAALMPRTEPDKQRRGQRHAEE